MVHRHTNIPIIVKANQLETPNYRSLIFERPRDFNFDAGDWIDIEFAGRLLKGGKTYSLSSSPTEAELMITFKDGLSEFKTTLMNARPGDKLTIKQYGNDYKFTLNPHAVSTLIAGGVGIAPFRSMLKEMYDTSSTNQVTVVYFNKDDNFLFKDELGKWGSELPGLTINYIVTAGLNKKAREKVLLSALQNPDQLFYIAGPEAMVEHAEHLLIDNGVGIKNIKIDSFGGY